MRVGDQSFPEALKHAADLLGDQPPDYESDLPLPLTEADPEDWAAQVDDARQRAAARPGILAVRTGFVPQTDQVMCRTWDQHLRDWWGWGLDEQGNVLMPHWNEQGKLTGCKVRRVDGGRHSLKGSRFSALYGAWRGARSARALICAGETDAAYATFTASRERLELDIFSVPRGEKSDVDSGWLELLRRHREVYLALDPDPAGIAGTRNWVAALRNADAKNIRVCILPIGRDLRDARPSLRRLLTQARRPLEEPAEIVANEHGYWRATKEGALRQVTNWTIEPVARLTGEGTAGFDVEVHSRGRAWDTILLLSDFANVSAIRRWATRQELLFNATDNDSQKIAQYVEARGSVVPEVFQTDQVGLHAPPEEYSFAGPTIVYPTGYTGQLPWRYAPCLSVEDVTGRVLLPTDSSQFRWSWLEAFLRLSGTNVMHPFLAWLIAAARRSEVAEFPLLFIGGSSGVGKSTLARIGMRLAGSALEADLGSNTPYVLLRLLSASRSLPVFVDEWTRLSRHDARLALQGYVPVLYAGGLAQRGQADLSTQAYKLSSPTIIAGEDTFTLDRELERLVRLSPSRAAQDPAALAEISGRPIESFAALLHAWLTRPELRLPQFPGSARTRPDYNEGILRTGWQTLRLFLAEAALHDPDVPSLSADPDLRCFDPHDDGEDMNAYELALAEGAALQDASGLPVVWDDSEGRGTWVRVQVLYGLLDQRRLDIELPGRSRAMRDYFRERYGKLHEARVSPPGAVKTVRAHLIPGLRITGLEATPLEQLIR